MEDKRKRSPAESVSEERNSKKQRSFPKMRFYQGYAQGTFAFEDETDNQKSPTPAVDAPKSKTGIPGLGKSFLNHGPFQEEEDDSNEELEQLPADGQTQDMKIDIQYSNTVSPQLEQPLRFDLEDIPGHQKSISQQAMPMPADENYYQNVPIPSREMQNPNQTKKIQTPPRNDAKTRNDNNQATARAPSSNHAQSTRHDHERMQNARKHTREPSKPSPRHTNATPRPRKRTRAVHDTSNENDPRTAVYQKQDNLLNLVRNPSTLPPKQPSPDLCDNIPVALPGAYSSLASFNTPTSQARRHTTAVQHSRPAPVSAEQSITELASKYTNEQLLNFVPNKTDVDVWGMRKRGLDWEKIELALRIATGEFVPATIKARHELMRAKRLLMPIKPEPKEPEPQPIEEEPTESLQEHAKVPFRPAAAPASAQEKPSDAQKLADTLEQERLAWTIKERNLQQRIQKLQEESTANATKLQEQEQSLKLKAEVEEKYFRLREEAQTQREKFQDEHTLRIKAERELKSHQSDVHRRSLAQAAAARPPARAEGAGFAFPRDEDEDETPEKKKTPSKRKAQKAREEAGHVREDGRPTTAGKSLPPAAIAALYKHLSNAQDEEEQEPLDLPATIKEEELTYFVYTVHRKQWLKHDAEPDTDGIICGQYTYLNEANAEVTNEILRPHGTDGIVIDVHKERSLHQGMSEHDMAWAHLDVPTGHVKVWVQRALHTEFTGELPTFEAKGLLSKTVFAIRQQTNLQDPNTASTVEEAEEIYTTFDLANRKASDRVFRLRWGHLEDSKRMDDITARTEADRARKRVLEDLEDSGQLFDEEVDVEGDATGKIKIWVVQKTVVGPRN